MKKGASGSDHAVPTIQSMVNKGDSKEIANLEEGQLLRLRVCVFGGSGVGQERGR
jgi:hypothetical protein